MSKLDKFFLIFGLCFGAWAVISTLTAWIYIWNGAQTLPLWNMLGLTLKIMSIV